MKNILNVYNRVDELELDAKSLLRHRLKFFGIQIPKEVKLYVTTNDHFQTYEVSGVRAKGVDVIVHVDGGNAALMFLTWEALIPYTIFTVVKELQLANALGSVTFLD